MELEQERKYDIIGGKIVNRSTGNPIPDDEPVMIFRAKDRNAISALSYYQGLCANKNHQDVIQGRIDDFQEFQDRFPEITREPDSSPHCLK